MTEAPAPRGEPAATIKRMCRGLAIRRLSKEWVGALFDISRHTQHDSRERFLGTVMREARPPQ
jgi:hypothetical protein